MRPQTKKQHLQQLVSEKNAWSRSLIPEEKKLGFLGWHERGYLPHCDFPGMVQLVTFRLRDSMPASRKGEWQHFLKIENDRERRIKLEEYLDKGIGNCELRNPKIAQITEDTLVHFHKKRYDLRAWCIMPNHVHVLHHVWQTPLWKTVQAWKIHITSQTRAHRSGRNAEHPLGLPDNPASAAPQPLWQREYWDTFMRDADQERKAIKYIEANPVKAKLCRTPENWPFSSARCRDKFRRLDLSAKDAYVG